MSYDPNKIVPKRDWILVLDEERKTITTSGLFIPTNETGIEKVREGAGMVKAVGPGEKNSTLGLSAGQRILYRGFLKHAHRIPTDEVWDSGTQKHYFLMSSDDVLGIIPSNVEIGVFSSKSLLPTERDKDAS